MYRKRLARLTSNHSDIRAHFVVRFDRINFKPILLRLGRAPGVNKILPDLSLRKFKTAPRSIWAQRYLVYAAPRLDKITTFT